MGVGVRVIEKGAKGAKAGSGGGMVWDGLVGVGPLDPPELALDDRKCVDGQIDIYMHADDQSIQCCPSRGKRG